MNNPSQFDPMQKIAELEAELDAARQIREMYRDMSCPDRQSTAEWEVPMTDADIVELMNEPHNNPFSSYSPISMLERANRNGPVSRVDFRPSGRTYAPISQNNR